MNGNIMLWTIISLLFLLWLAGIIFKLSMGGLLHIILIVAVILLVFNLLRSTKTEHKSI
ncbi:MAG: lmo0937 family membrane protein [Bacteroidetes bacterium]|nr:lmo0937 family membrane protein [Bacteroidota bacterium]